MAFLINYLEAGITAPSYFSRIKSLISCEFNTSKRALISSLSSSPLRTAMTFTYGLSSPDSMAIESSNGFNSFQSHSSS